MSLSYIHKGCQRTMLGSFVLVGLLVAVSGDCLAQKTVKPIAAKVDQSESVDESQIVDSQPVETISRTDADGKQKILVVTGQSSKYHNWALQSRTFKQMLHQTGLFNVDSIIAPEKGADMSEFNPEWSKYAAVVLDYDGDEWSEATKRSFVEYMHNGGGLIVVHGSDNAFPDWKEYNRMIGVGGWAGRTEAWGPKVRWREGKKVLDESPGTAQHPAGHDFLVVNRAPEHPIMKGVPNAWLHANDELYSQLRGPAENLTVLATASASTSMRNGTGENEPILMALAYGKGRVFHTTLGHVSPREKKPPASIRCAGFVVTLQRGTEWAATGIVTQEIPKDFPAADATSVRVDKRILSGSSQWKPLELKDDEKFAARPMLSGETTHLAKFQVDAIALAAGQDCPVDAAAFEHEQLFIIKSGAIEVQLVNEDHTLGKGSVVIVLPGDPYSITATSESAVELYRMMHRSREPMSMIRGKRAGGSFVVDYTELKFEPHRRGGLRDYYDRQTAMCGYFEMHVTTLNSKTISHALHTHRAEEIILMIEGNAEEYIGNNVQPIEAGDLAFLDSDVPHAIRNTGTTPCMYFAFQWQ